MMVVVFTVFKSIFRSWILPGQWGSYFYRDSIHRVWPKQSAKV